MDEESMDVPYELLKYIVLIFVIGIGVALVAFLGPEGILRLLENIIGIFLRPLASN